MYLRQSGYAWKQHFPQLQFQLMVTKWDYMDLYSYHPDLPPGLLRTEPKADYIETLTNIVGEFSIKLEKEYTAMVADGLAPEKWRKAAQMPKPAALSQLSAIDVMRQALIDVQK